MMKRQRRGCMKIVLTGLGLDSVDCAPLPASAAAWRSACVVLRW